MQIRATSEGFPRQEGLRSAPPVVDEDGVQTIVPAGDSVAVGLPAVVDDLPAEAGTRARVPSASGVLAQAAAQAAQTSQGVAGSLLPSSPMLHVAAIAVEPASVSPEAPLLEALALAGSTQPSMDARRLRACLGSDRDAVELAPFFVMGDRHYRADNPERERLISLSLEGIGKCVDGEGAWSFLASREERAEAMRLLLPLFPPDEPTYVFNSDITHRVYQVQKVITDSFMAMDAPSVYNFGPSETLPIRFVRPALSDPSVLAGIHTFVELLSDLTASVGRPDSRPHLNDDTHAAHAMCIIRNDFQGDPKRTAELREWMRQVGDPWHARGIMHHLDRIDPALRAEASDRVSTELQAVFEKKLAVEASDAAAARRMRAERRECMGSAAFTPAEIAGTTREVVDIFELMQPQEEFEAFTGDLRAALATLLPPPVTSLSATETQELQQRLHTLARFRDPGVSISQAATDYQAFASGLEAVQVPQGVADRLVGVALERRADLAAALPPGAATSAGILGEIERMVVEKSPVPAMPASQVPDWLDAALALRSPGESLESACTRMTSQWSLLRDLKGQERLEALVRQEIDKGTFGEATIETVLPEIHAAVQMARVLGRSPEQAVEEGIRKVARRLGEASHPTTTARVETGDGFVTIGGMRIPVRRTDT